MAIVDPRGERKLNFQQDGGLASQVGPVLFVTSIFFLNFLSRVILAPLLPSIQADLGVGQAVSGSFFFYLSAGYCPSLILSGLVASRLDHRRTLILSTCLVGSSMVLVGFASNAWMVRSGMLVVGAASGLYLPSGIATITSLVSPRHWGKALAIHELAPNLGLVCAPLLAELVIPLAGWRGVLITVGLLGFITATSFARWGKGGRFKGQAPDLQSLLSLGKRPSLWIMGLVLALGLGSSMGVFTMITLFFVDAHGLERTAANLLAGLSRVSGLFMALAAGWANDRFGPKRTLAAVLAVSGLLTTALGLSPAGAAQVLVFFQSAVAACLFPSAMASLAMISPPAQRNLSVSLAAAMATLLGAGVIPAGLGFLGEFGKLNLGMAVLGFLVFAGALLVPILKFIPQSQQD